MDGCMGRGKGGGVGDGYGEFFFVEIGITRNC